MKTYSFVLTSLLIILIAGCNKDGIENVPNEIIVTIMAENPDEAYSKFLVVENSKSSSKYIQITDEVNTLLRGTEILGDRINLHIVSIHTILEDYWNIESYYDLPIGLNIDLSKKEVSGNSEPIGLNGMSTISFTDIPDFDVATRSAHYPGHSHTYANLEVPCGNKYSIGDNFYVCLQKNEDAGYKLVEVSDTNEFVIPLGGLNYDMTNYSIAKDPDHRLNVKVKAYGNDGVLEIFNKKPNEDNLFPGDFVDVFVPNGIPEMNKFSTNVNFNTGSYSKNSLYYDDEVNTDYSFLDVGLVLNYTTGELPEINTSSNEYDLIRLYMIEVGSEMNHSWNIFLPSSESLYLPEFPEEVLKAIAENFYLSHFFTKNIRITASAIDDSRFNNYSDAYDFYLKTRAFNVESYYTLSDIKYY